MIKRTLFISNPCRLSLKDNQLIANNKDEKGNKTAPIEDLGFVVIENPQTKISMPLLAELVKNNTSVIFCDQRFYPCGMLLNLDGHHLQQEIFHNQINASVPLKKNLWKQTIEAKIWNQAAVLKKLGKDHKAVAYHKDKVKSGDIDNREGAAARVYWPQIFGGGFCRDRYGSPPNNMLNYTYAILRSAVARALSGSGLLATLGIHHHNRYNAFCLADDIMEPYRPFADGLVHDIYENPERPEDLDTGIKMKLLKVLSMDVAFNTMKRPLSVGLSITTASLARCFMGDDKKINFPVIT